MFVEMNKDRKRDGVSDRVRAYIARYNRYFCQYAFMLREHPELLADIPEPIADEALEAELATRWDSLRGQVVSESRQLLGLSSGTPLRKLRPKERKRFHVLLEAFNLITLGQFCEYVDSRDRLESMLRRRGRLHNPPTMKDGSLRSGGTPELIETTPQACAPLILIVEDGDESREMYAQFLCFSGYRTHQATHGGEAVHLMMLYAYDLVLVDLAMPIMDGFEFLRIMRRLRCAIPIVVLTGHALSGLSISNLFPDAKFLTKPCDLEELIKAIETALPGRKAPTDISGEPPARLA